MALGDKVEELQRSLATQQERLDNAVRSLDKMDGEQKEMARELAEFRREHEKEIALLKQWKDDQKKERDESSRRLWAFGPNIVSALISGLISAAVAYFVSRH